MAEAKEASTLTDAVQAAPIERLGKTAGKDRRGDLPEFKGGRLVSDATKHNLLYFQSFSMHGLYEEMDQWQRATNRRLLSTSIERDGETYCCIALTNPSEVVITSADGERLADVNLVDGLQPALRVFVQGSE